MVYLQANFLLQYNQILSYITSYSGLMHTDRKLMVMVGEGKGVHLRPLQFGAHRREPVGPSGKALGW